MRYLRHFLIILSAVMVLSTMVLVAEANGQRRRSVSGGYTYPVVTRRVYIRRPFFYSPFYDPFYDPYFYDPYLREQRDRYYRQKAVRDARRELARHREKYSADGVITAKERKELIDDEQDLAKALRRLREYGD